MAKRLKVISVEEALNDVEKRLEVSRLVLQECTDSIAARFFAAVRPIYLRKNNGVPRHIATSTLLEVSGAKYLITAAHVIDDSKRGSLLAGGDTDLVYLPISQPFWISPGSAEMRDADHLDYFIWRLPSDVVEALGNVQYIREAQIADSEEEIHDRNFLALGYPYSKNKKVDVSRRSITPTRFPFSSLVHEKPELAKELGVSGRDHLFLDYSPKHSKNDKGQIVNSVAVTGMSGGPLIDMGIVAQYVAKRVVHPEREPHYEGRLAGLLIECRDKHGAIVAVRISLILKAAGLLS